MEHFKIGDILLSLTSETIFLLLGIIATFLGRFLFIILPSKKLWDFAEPDKVLICVATIKTNTGEYIRPSTGIGEVRALAYIIASLSIGYKKINFKKILLSEEGLRHDIEDDIILLGGPKNNQITKLFFEKIKDLNLLYQDEDGTITINKNTVQKVAIKDNKVSKDYGLIVKMKNPFASTHKNTKLFLFSGHHTYGLIAATKYFCESIYKDKEIKLKRKDNIAVLVSCDVCDGYPFSIKREAYIKFKV